MPLILDAKYKNLTTKHTAWSHDLEHSARRYARAFGGMAFLVHPVPATFRGNRAHGIYWPAKSSTNQVLASYAREEDYPLVHGVIEATPAGDAPEEVSGLRRVLTAWLVKNGIYWVCFRCGHNMTDGHHLENKKVKQLSMTYQVCLRSDSESIKRRHPNTRHSGYVYQCPACSMRAVLSHCHRCNKQNIHTPILKHFYKNKERDAHWIEKIEIMHQSKKQWYIRHCPRCGSDDVPKK